MRRVGRSEPLRHKGHKETLFDSLCLCVFVVKTWVLRTENQCHTGWTMGLKDQAEVKEIADLAIL